MGPEILAALYTAPVPQPDRLSPISVLLCRADVMNHIEHVEEGRRDRHSPVDARLPLFRALDHES